MGLYVDSIQSALHTNRYDLLNPDETARAKVIRYQLNSQTREELSELQGIEYSSIGNIFADMEVNLLPKILALIGQKHGHSEFYTTLLPVAPDLLSFINRKAIMVEERAKNTSKASDITAQIAALTQQLSIISDKNDQIDKRLALIELEDGDSKQTTVVERGKERSGGEKRQRIN